jgi:diguanylate cyclase (GGDEF)-like protein
VALLLGAVASLLLLWLLAAGARGAAQPFPSALHTVLESVTVLTYLLSFCVAWQAHRAEQPANVVVLGCGLLAAALLDFVHALSYEGMPDFLTPSSVDKSIAFGLATHLTVDLTLACVAFLPWRPFQRRSSRLGALAGSLLAAALLLALGLGLPERVPRFFVAPLGLTPAKIALECLGLAILLATGARLWRLRGRSEFDVEGLLAAVGLFACATVALCLYTQPNHVLNLFGHLCKLAASIIIYRAVFSANVRRPSQRLSVEIALREMAQHQLRSLAYFDTLTGLPNAHHLQETLAGRFAAGQPAPRLALLVLGLEGLDTINDSHGHAFGDRVIRTVADRLVQRHAECGSVFRLGGGRFAILLEQPERCAAALALARSLRAEIAAPLPVLGMETAVTASVGVAIAPEHGASVDELLCNAGAALHDACAHPGGASLAYEPAMSQRAIERFSLRSGIRRALERGEFELHYQPQFDLQSARLVGVEALLRWRHPEHGTVSPARFIPEAEDSGLIVPLGAWVLKEACRQAALWRNQGIALPAVAVNLSAKQFQLGEVESAVGAALRAAQLEPGVLELELTESILLNETESTLATLQRLKALGVRLAIDDFGTGYSSLAYLRAFPIDKLKIDQSFVRGLDQEPGNEVIVATIIQLARSLRMQTMAEGVETEAAAALLLRLGCVQAQGYLYARPMPAAQMSAFLQAWREHGRFAQAPAAPLRPAALPRPVQAFWQAG